MTSPVPVLDGTEDKNYSIRSFRLRYTCRTPPPKGNQILASPERVVSAARGIYETLDGGMSVEHFGVWYLNVQNELIGFKVFNTGTIDQVVVYPRLVVHAGLMVGTSGMILMHNHPSGHPDPSEEDKRLTRAIKEAALLFDIRVLDHLIVSQGGYFSFLERGLL